MQDDLEALAVRVEAADGPNFALDCEIWVALHPQATQHHVPPAYTSSVDIAAILLVPDGCGWTAGWGQTLLNEPMGGAVVVRNARFIGYDANYDDLAYGEAATPALALCAAAVRARAHLENDNAG